MLFAAPLPPVVVPRTRAVVIGRSEECGLRLSTRRASRRHAEVRFENDVIVVEDLGSTNGTFVNGEKIEGLRVLEPGDRIDVGGVHVVYCQVKDGVESLSASAADTTAVLPRGPDLSRADGAFRGDLSEVPMPALLQMLAEGGKTGLLSVVTPRGAARLWMEKGRPVHASTATKEGVDAAFELCRLAEGRFLFATDHPLRARTIDCSVMELLLESSRAEDELRAGASGR